ncbi:MAG: hypothetical protein AB7L13_25115 [Acidimicrobiia bacterium]
MTGAAQTLIETPALSVARASSGEILVRRGDPASGFYAVGSVSEVLRPLEAEGVRQLLVRGLRVPIIDLAALIAAECEDADDVAVLLSVVAAAQGDLAAWRAGLVSHGEIVARDDNRRYGGPIARVLSGWRTLVRLGPMWFEIRPHIERPRIIPVFGAAADTRRAVIELFGGFVADAEGDLMPIVNDERDVRWYQGNLYVRGDDGNPVVLEPAYDVADAASLALGRLVWGERDTEWEDRRGHVFVGDTRWRGIESTGDGGVAVVGAPSTAPDDMAAVLLTGTADIVEPLWRALARMVCATWRAPAVDRGDDGQPLRHPPIVLIGGTGERFYGLLAESAEHAAQVADAFGVHWVRWPRSGGIASVVRLGETVTTAAVAAPADVAAPIEGDTLWDDEHFGSGRVVSRRMTASDAVAEIRRALRAERDLEAADREAAAAAAVQPD